MTAGTTDGAARIGRVAAWVRRQWLECCVAVAVVGAVIPVAVAAVGRIADHWQPADDEAAIARLAHDVFTRHPPLLGMPSTIGNGVKLTGGVPHHLGPMLFWLFAVPDRLTGSSPSALVVTIALVNIVSIAAFAWQVRRRAGSYAAIAAMFGVTVMLWSFGRDLTVQIWNPYAALLPFLLFLGLAWSVACGDRLALPLAALVGSFVIQCHILYAVPVVGVGVLAVVGFVLAERAERVERAQLAERAEGADSESPRRGRGRALVATAVVLACCWSTAVYDEVRNRPGNLNRLWRSLRGSHQAPLGTTDAFRLTARSVAVPPLFARRLPTTAANAGLVRPLGLWALLGAVVVVGLVAVMAIASRRRAGGDTWLGVLALAAVALAALVLARLPVEFGGITIYRDRFVWIVGFFAWIALGVLAGRAVAARRSRERGTGSSAVAGAAVVLAVVTLASGVVAARQRSPAFAVAADESVAVSQLTRQVRTNLTARGPYLLQAGGSRAILTVGFGVMWDLVRHGYDIRVLADDPYLGSAHGLPARTSVPRLLVVSSDGRVRPPAGSTRVASFTADPSVRSRLAREEAAVVSRLGRQPPRITVAGRTLIAGSEANAAVDALRSIAAGRHDWRALLESHLLRGLVLAGLVALPEPDGAALEHFDNLLSEAADAYLSVFVVAPPT
ncbi:MAG: hypothetical protein QOH10_1196 [Actinomycetota bacterium]|nr:hypothetical protein [Actinomycetota bacterium]